jgi:uncharacterized protein (UPF0332 family)
MLKTAMALMFSHGQRPRSQPGHHDELLAVFDHLRRKRNTALYDDTGFVSHRDGQEAVQAAREFVDAAKTHINSKRSSA